MREDFDQQQEDVSEEMLAAFGPGGYAWTPEQIAADESNSRAEQAHDDAQAEEVYRELQAAGCSFVGGESVPF